jgi:hypothetical protein
MAKTVTVQGQQKWEYRTATKHTEASLLAELNELGKAGWELITASFNKDLKGVWAWTGILKRPSAQAAGPEVGSQATETAPQAATSGDKPAAGGSPPGFDLSGDTFDVKTG